MTDYADLRAAALRSLELDHAYSLSFDALRAGLARGVLELLAERDSGRHLAEERFDAEMAEVRDGLVELSGRIDRQVVRVESHDVRLRTLEGISSARQ